jgi:hypothetical protein
MMYTTWCRRSFHCRKETKKVQERKTVVPDEWGRVQREAGSLRGAGQQQQEVMCKQTEAIDGRLEEEGQQRLNEVDRSCRSALMLVTLNILYSTSKHRLVACMDDEFRCAVS